MFAYGSPIALSLQDLVERSQQGLLFATSPQANIVAATPRRTPLPRSNPLDRGRKDGGVPPGHVQFCGSAPRHRSESIRENRHKASRFGIMILGADYLKGWGRRQGGPAALRRLCVGRHEAGDGGPRCMYSLGPESVGENRRGNFEFGCERLFVPAAIAEECTPRLRQHIGIRALDTPGIEALPKEISVLLLRAQLTPIEM